MPRQEKREEQIKLHTVGIHPSTWEALRFAAFRRRTTISRIIRELVEQYLKSEASNKAGKG